MNLEFRLGQRKGGASACMLSRCSRPADSSCLVRRSCIGLVNHLSLDVERFWFQAVTAGNQIAIEDVLASSDNASNVSDEEPVEEVLHRYTANIEHADGIIASRSLDAVPAWWPDFFGTWRLDSLREIVLHVVAETATHAVTLIQRVS
jgi:uncharacterized damage-inducible protein DinB